MPDYVTMSEMNGSIPIAFLVQALDDDEDGSADTAAWTAVLGAVHKDIDGTLGVRFTVPFANPLPPVVSKAAQLFAAERLYLCRGFAEDKNPWTKQANDMRDTLAKIAKGEVPLTPTTLRAAPSAGAITEQSKATSKRRQTSA